MAVVINERPAPGIDADLLAAWKEIPVSIAVDLEPGQQIDNAIRPQTFGGGPLRLIGPAMTVSCTTPDFGAVVHALDQIQAGEVLVIAAGGALDVAVVGEILGGHLREIGCAGIVVDGVVRDIETLGSFPDFPVYARGVNPRGPSSASEGEINAQVTLGGCLVTPGDLILGDRDGLAVLPADLARSRLAEAQEKIVQEQRWIADLKDRKPVTEVFGL